MAGQRLDPHDGSNAKKPIMRICFLNLTLSVKSCPGIVNATSLRGAEMDPSPRETKVGTLTRRKFNVGPFEDDAKMGNLTVGDLGESRFICL